MSWRLIKGWETPTFKVEPQVLYKDKDGRYEAHCEDGHIARYSEEFMRSKPEWFAQDLPDGWMRPEDGVDGNYYFVWDGSNIYYSVRERGDYYPDYPASVRYVGVKYIKPIDKPEPPKL